MVMTFLYWVEVEGCQTIVGFRQYVGKLLKLVGQAGPSNDNDVSKVVRKVKAEVQKIPLPREYDLGSSRHERVIQGTSSTLLKDLSPVLCPGKKQWPNQHWHLLNASSSTSVKAAKYTSNDAEKYLRVLGLERSIGPIHSWGDNFDLVVFTPNGCRATCHGHSVCAKSCRDPVSWCGYSRGWDYIAKSTPSNKLQAEKFCPVGNSSLAIEHYTTYRP